MDITWRPVTADDIPAWNALIARAEAVDQTGEHYNEDDLAEELADPAQGPDDRLAAWDADTMVAFAAVRPREAITDHWRVEAEGTVDPSHRGTGLGTRGLAWAAERAATLQRERHPDVELRFQVTGYLARADQVSLLESAGLTAVNWTAVMRAHLDRAQPSSQPERWPPGHRLLTYSRELSAATMAAHNAAFEDHWGFVPWTPTMWEQWVDGTRNARFDLSFVLVPDSEPDLVVGYILTSEFDAYEQATGRREAYVAKIGVRREARGQGIASQLIRHALAAYRAAGFQETSLDVDTNNPTGAFGLYERAGYEVETLTAIFQRVLPPLAAQPGAAS
jgi:ribosomal protein S18 acetylase RimI-like enzyme